MRNGPRSIDEFKVARAFGAIAAMVALYGVALSATALVEQPAAADEQSRKWYERVEPALRKVPESNVAGGRRHSFWAPAEAGVPARTIVGADAAPRIGSFWAKRDAAAPFAGWQLASGAGHAEPRF